MKKGLIWALVIVVVAALVVLRVVGSGGKAPARSIEEIHAAEGIPVDVVTVSTGTLEVVREIVGEVSGYRQSILRASADYKIAEVLVREGERVTRGQTLARYDVATAPDFTARLSQAKESYENAVRQVDRLAPLFAQGAISESDLDAAKTQLAIAAADLRNARLELEVVSPIDGVAALVAVARGDAIASGEVIAQVAVLDSVRVEANVSAETARALRMGAVVSVPEVTPAATGRITRVAMAPDPDTRLFRVEATIGGNARSLQPGTVVVLAVTVQRVGPVRVLPRAAILGSDAPATGGSVEVYVAADSTAERRFVGVGAVTESAVEATSGLDDGDRVVVFGANRLSDGVKIRIHRADGVPVAEAASGEGNAR
jgi:RND family efflux transporter MFP subunit